MNTYSKQQLLDQWLKENWTVGQYCPSKSFLEIKNHSCVCRKRDMGLICVTGPAEDIESQKMSDLFATAPVLLKKSKEILEWFEYTHASTALRFELEKIIDKAEGHL